MPRKEQGWVTFQTSEEERKILEEFCQHSQRTKTEILRELVRGLDGYTSSSAPPIPTKSKEKKKTDDLEVATIVPKRPLKVSSRNILKGIVKQVVRGEVSTQVTLRVVHEVELTSIITTNAADELEIIEGTEAYAVIKSNDIAIAKD
ncbi:TOBE domain-containing protein [Anabaena subtropica]|uniref:TOBE domain-containing protein n=1 Tax=Anabaena subtropica FACHB-260 TaxID=2692884 RepID=A0ABR8CX42_9NOST|nr:molybdopterin-binding protein [Anabaena subtropica]MBD2347015.1 TOBE domain-containing protein [Anabaena subtropica FACHB-260]